MILTITTISDNMEGIANKMIPDNSVILIIYSLDHCTQQNSICKNVPNNLGASLKIVSTTILQYVISIAIACFIL